jgi:hypothetical protein
MNMKKGLFAALAVGALFAGTAMKLALADDMKDMKMSGGKEESMVMKGEILDMSCYLTMGASGAKHKKCAIKCLKKGSPVGFLDEGGKAYFLVDDHDNEEAYLAARKLGGDKVALTGKMLGDSAILVEKVEKQ